MLGITFVTDDVKLEPAPTPPQSDTNSPMPSPPRSDSDPGSPGSDGMLSKLSSGSFVSCHAVFNSPSIMGFFLNIPFSDF